MNLQSPPPANKRSKKISLSLVILGLAWLTEFFAFTAGGYFGNSFFNSYLNLPLQCASLCGCIIAPFFSTRTLPQKIGLMFLAIIGFGLAIVASIIALVILIPHFEL